MWFKALDDFRDRLKTEWIRVWGNSFAKEWDKLVCTKWVRTKDWVLIKDQIFELLEISVESYEWNWLWFSKKIKISWFPDEEFNPKKFKKI